MNSCPSTKYFGGIAKRVSLFVSIVIDYVQDDAFENMIFVQSHIQYSHSLILTRLETDKA